ncbi:rab GTPase-activating protein 22-like [Apium graveolens]|uniref:rab GTPase-activating protein 22-like n=1 Tax=Apium graveolens TaxID=4045 RepID=UPI003D7A9E10
MLLRYLTVKFSDVLSGGSADAKLIFTFTAVVGIAIAAAVFYSNRGHLKSPWALSKRKKALSTEQWRLLFTLEGKFHDEGVRFLKTVRRGGVDPGIRAEVWPFLLGVYELNSSEEERHKLRTKKRKDYDKLRSRCQQLIEFNLKVNEVRVANKSGNDKKYNHAIVSTDTKEVNSRESPKKEMNPSPDYLDDISSALLETSKTELDVNTCNTGSVNSDTSVEQSQTFTSTESTKENGTEVTSKENVSNTATHLKFTKKEDFITWQQIIHVDAIRANREWIAYSPTLAAVSDERARSFAEAVGLKEYDKLEPCMIFHAARLVALLEAYCLYDPEVGYCQGMSDLLSPIITVMTEDHDAFWCFVGFMKKARHNFKLDEVGIRRQLSKVSMIIKCKDSQLFQHLQMLQADDCFFVYRMVVVLFRRELTFEQTICLWEVMWADQAAIRAGIGYSVWSRIRHLALPTEDLLLYAIAASILQRRKLIIERYSSMDEIMTECHSMAGHLDVWKLLDDAHNLVFSLHDKVETPT